MSLFVVNRYEDEEWKKGNDDSQNHLSDLLKRIAERKREREAAAKAAAESKVETAKKEPEKVTKSETVQDKTTEPTDEAPKKKGKKKKGKKRKLDPPNEEVPVTQNVDSITENGEESKKDATQITQEDFTILGSKKRLKTQVAKRVLPHWLTHPEIVHSDLSKGPMLDDMQNVLDSKLVDKLKADGFDKLFPVQARVLAWLVKCDQDYKTGKWVRDTCVSMPTGSGKTLAYALPIIQLLQHNFVRLVRCLIVLPVQELATQVYDVISKYSTGTSLRIALISGASLFKEEQEKLVQKTEKDDYISRVDIVIATPGRLIDHIRKTEGFSLSALRFLVIDEADRATEWLQYIPFPHSKAPPLSVANVRSSWNTPAQKLLLSATLSQDPEKLSRLGLFRPVLFTSSVVDLEKTDKDINLDEDLNVASRYGNPSELTERIVECSIQHKPLALYQQLMKDEVIEKTLVFTNSAEAAHRLAILLQSLLKSKDVTVGELSAQLGSKQREETLEKFIQGSLRVLVSSDALARGLDIPGIKLVVSYDLPKHVKGYIHRAGRTGRGGHPGTAISLLLPNQIALFSRMLNKVGKSVPTPEKESLDEVAESVNYESHLENLQTTLANEQEQNIRRLKSHKRVIKT
ncbi:hypothetical protein TSAR_015753 [Trichomalopsis sarcophagae]|uniref:ATP-dependent RNA helicase n=1 Tax=Trichomalopsis sarcophagae TaxID=543379 RepID=A0A232ENT8_9HYME|nr:hypothetical protein TSAR_015753 [Trichomalopsis sarcophagae]